MQEADAPGREQRRRQRRQPRQDAERDVVAEPDRGGSFGAGERSDRADQPQRRDPLRQQCGAGRRVGTATRDAHDAELREPGRIGEFGDVLRIVGQRAPAAIARDAEARPLRRQQPDAELARDRIGDLKHEARAGRAVQA